MGLNFGIKNINWKIYLRNPESRPLITFRIPQSQEGSKAYFAGALSLQFQEGPKYEFVMEMWKVWTTQSIEVHCVRVKNRFLNIIYGWSRLDCSPTIIFVLMRRGDPPPAGVLVIEGVNICTLCIICLLSGPWRHCKSLYTDDSGSCPGSSVF